MNSDLGDRPEWILRLLYAPVKGRSGLSIVGITRLMKACFLIDRHLRDELGKETSFQFRPDRYGPLDPEVYNAIDFLEMRGFIDRQESEDYEGVEFLLTETGESKAAVIFNELSEDERRLLSWIKKRHVLQPLPKLLSFVYNQYPDMAENSELIE